MLRFLISLALIFAAGTAAATTFPDFNKEFCENFLQTGLPDFRTAQIPEYLHLLRELRDFEPPDLYSRLQKLSEVQWPVIAQYVAFNLHNPKRLTLYRLADVYFARYRQILLELPDPARQDFTVVRLRLERYQKVLREKLDDNFPYDEPIAHVLRRLSTWSPKTTRQRREAFQILNHASHDSFTQEFASFVAGNDSFQWQRREAALFGKWPAATLGMPGQSDRDIYSPLHNLAAIWDWLNLKPGESFVELGSGDSRVGASLQLLRPGVRYTGLELVPLRVRRARQMALALDFPSETFTVLQCDLSDPHIQIPLADYYYVFNPFDLATLENVLHHLQTNAETRPFRLIVRSPNIFSDHNDDSELAKYYPPLPLWLRRTARFHEGFGLIGTTDIYETQEWPGW